MSKPKMSTNDIKPKNIFDKNKAIEKLSTNHLKNKIYSDSDIAKMKRFLKLI